MATALTTITDEARIALDTLSGRAAALFSPSIRLGVTGLSRAGKTVFISALVHNLVHGGRLPLFEAQKSGRISRAFLEEQPDDAVPRFQYEDHIEALVDQRIMAGLDTRHLGTAADDRIRVCLRLEPFVLAAEGYRSTSSTIPANGCSIFRCSARAMPNSPATPSSWRRCRSARTCRGIGGNWPGPSIPKPTPTRCWRASWRRSFAAYLKACKLDERALSTLPPGRFLMPGDLDGSPALTFAPLPNLGDIRPRSGSLQAMMERRYEAYKTHVVKPFFREHITRLDRQIVLIDAMQALNAGPGAIADLERSVTEILACFRPGRGGFLTDLFSRRIDRILIAATKADHLHHESHDRLQAIVRRLADRAIGRADFSGAEVDVLAMAAVRATREGTVKQGRETLPVIIGTPLKGETIGGETFDGKTETAIFPGDLPAKLELDF